MGTRNLTMVISQGETKVAQYGQWDGYPEGQGKTILNFLRKCDLDKFKTKVNKLRWITDAESKKIYKDKNWVKKYPYLNRDTGGEILNAIYYGEMEITVDVGKREKIKVEFLSNEEEFAGDSLMNEWTYVIDLDKNTFEVYKGFNTDPLTQNDRFFKYFNNPSYRTDVYYPVKLAKTYSLSKLPKNDKFIADFVEEE